MTDFSEILREEQEMTDCALCKFSEKSDKPGCFESSVNRVVSRPYSGHLKCRLTFDSDCKGLTNMEILSKRQEIYLL